MNHVNYTDFLGNQIEAVAQLMDDPSFFKNKKLEIMVHPDYNNAGLIIDKINKLEYGFDYPEQLTKFILAQNMA
jgi:hypothetical protein